MPKAPQVASQPSGSPTPPVPDHVKDALVSLERAHQGVTRQYQIQTNPKELSSQDNFVSDFHEMEGNSVSQGSVQMRAKAQSNLEIVSPQHMAAQEEKNGRPSRNELNETLKKTNNTNNEEQAQLGKVESSKEMTKETLVKSNQDLKLVSERQINIVETPGREDTSVGAIEDVTAVLKIE